MRHAKCTAAEAQTTDLRELRAALKKWQIALGLQAWRIKLLRGKPLSDAEAQPTPFSAELCADSVGHTWWIPESPNVVISLRKDQGIHTLLHEMLHLRLEGHRPEACPYDPAYERAINHLVEALLSKPDLVG